MSEFIVYPAIDLRAGQVVRLAQGDPDRQTIYANEPVAVAVRWQEAGARWLHVVNLDGAFGDDDQANRQALAQILAQIEIPVQFGGGLRTAADVDRALELGVSRAILGTAAVETPEVLSQSLSKHGPEALGVGIDARGGRVRVRGWLEIHPLEPLTLAAALREQGVRTVIFTNIARDGLGAGLDLATSVELARKTGLQIIASGGVGSLEDVKAAREAGLSGVIIGRALYDGRFALAEALAC